MYTGTVKWFNAKLGYGFIAGDDGKDALVHQTAVLMDGYRTLEDGQTVSYDTEATDKGIKAINVMPE